MDAQRPRDTQPLPPHDQYPGVTFREWLAGHRRLAILAIGSAVLLILAAIGAWYVLSQQPAFLFQPPKPEPPASLSDLAAEYPELASVFNDEKLDSVYKEYMLVYTTDGPQAALDLARQRGLVNANDELRLTLELDTTDSADLQAELESNGIRVTAASGKFIDIAIPLSVLEEAFETGDPGSLFSEITGLEHIVKVRVPDYGSQDAGPVEIESLAAIGASDWQAAGYTGKGVKIGVLDMGFKGYKDLLGTELPASVTVQSFIEGVEADQAETEHGTAVAEIIHDIAPDAELYLAAFQTGVEMSQAADWLVSQQVDIISESVSWIYGPTDATSYQAQVLESVVANGVFWANSSGNYATTHYRGTFTDEDGNGYHEFGPGDEYLGFIPSKPMCKIVLNWNAWVEGDQDYDLYMYDRDGNVLASSLNTQDGPGDDSAEGFLYEFSSEDTYFLGIYAKQITRPAIFDLIIDDTSAMEYFNPEYSLATPADAPSSFTVGATYWSDDSLETYSSQGPTMDGRLKPEISAPAGVTSAAYGGEAFYGTSASTPHVAAAAGLVLQAYPDSTPAHLADFLRGRAIDLGNSGPDNAFGYGRLWLGEAPNPQDILPTQVPTQEAPPEQPTEQVEPTSTTEEVGIVLPTPKQSGGTTPEPSSGGNNSLGWLAGLFLCVFLPGLLGLGGIGLVGFVYYRSTRRPPARTPPAPVRRPPARPAERRPAAPTPAPAAPERVPAEHIPAVYTPAEPAPTEANLCPRCGNLYRPGARFCSSCGFQMSTEPARADGAAEATVRCTNCGEQLRAASKFCPQCGQPR